MALWNSRDCSVGNVTVVVTMPSLAGVERTERRWWRRSSAAFSGSAEWMRWNVSAASFASRGPAPFTEEMRSLTSFASAFAGGLVMASCKASAVAALTSPLSTASASSGD